MISFVILHYKNMNDTLECIASIKKMDKKHSYSIIVVDNGSATKEEIDQLRNEAEVLALNSNCGFAQGNNAGCKLAIEKYNPDFLAVINNDILIEQNDFIDKIYECYEEDQFDVLGPKILTNGSDSVNPFPAYKNLDEINKAIDKATKLIKIYENPILRTLLKSYLKIKYTFKDVKHLTNGKEKVINASLHGCALIFSKKYYQKYENVFYPETFLYHEEEFLDYRKNKDHLLFVYNPKIELFHKEGSSLNYRFQKEQYKKLIFQQKNIKKSLELLKKIMIEKRSI